MLRYPLRLAFTTVAALALLLCAALVTLWVESFRQRFSLLCTRVDERPEEWVVSAWTVSLEPSCVYIEHCAPLRLSQSDVLAGPQGEVRICLHDPPPNGCHWYAEVPGPRWDWAINRQDLRWEFARFARAARDYPDGVSFRLTVIPLYVVVLAAAGLPVLWFRIRLQRRQAARLAAAGLCPSCGYDLRASFGRCPECGVVADVGGGEAGRRPLDDHTRRPSGRPGWAYWALAVACVSVAALVLAAALFFSLRFIPPLPPRTWWPTPMPP